MRKPHRSDASPVMDWRLILWTPAHVG